MKIKDSHQKALQKLFPGKEQAFIDATLDRAIQQEEAKQTRKLTLFADGGSRGNPGPSGGGFSIIRGSDEVAHGAEFYGELTNNQAEYLALRDALRTAYELDPEGSVECFMDSNLVVQQLKGEFKVKSPNVKALFEEVRRIADQFPHFDIHHIPREQNKRADALANRAMDRG
ncbi:ribonuclease HI family protein [Candidatus Peregrinibacteria bacterium]|nr:MAG: ribonuclease HI family protein [Candidatus Peregrinibacteria bacterium]